MHMCDMKMIGGKIRVEKWFGDWEDRGEERMTGRLNQN